MYATVSAVYDEFRPIINFCPASPLFVVTMTAPLPAFDPYNAAEVAPLRTLMSAISLGFRSSNAAIDEMAPSIMMSAWFPADIDLKPLKIIWVDGLTLL